MTKPISRLSMAILSITIILTLTMVLCNFNSVSGQQEKSFFDFNKVIARIQPISPAEDESYLGDVPIELSIRYSVQSEF